MPFYSKFLREGRIKPYALVSLVDDAMQQSMKSDTVGIHEFSMSKF